MKLKTKIVKVEKQLEQRINHERSAIERVGATACAVITLFGMTHLGKQAKELAGAATLPKAGLYNVMVEHNNTHNEIEQSETTRMPVKFDEGIRLPIVTGQ